MSKYLANNAGQITEVAATTTSTGTGDAGKLVGLDANGRLDNSFMPVGIGADTASIQAGEALAAGDYVNIHNVSGNARVRKADASASGKEAHGFVLSAVAAGASATVYFEGSNNQVSGQTPGVVYLHTTAGQGSPTAPAAPGQIVQRLGFATSATSVNFQSHAPILLA